MKTCGKCKKHKKNSEFNKYYKSHDGLQGYCRHCMSVYNKRIYTNKTIPEYKKEHKIQVRIEKHKPKQHPIKKEDFYKFNDDFVKAMDKLNKTPWQRIKDFFIKK